MEKKNIDLNTVSIDDEFGYPLPEIKETKYVQGFLGPFPKIEDHYNKKEDISKKAIFGLVLGPGAHRALGHITFLKYLDSKNIEPHLLSGNEMGAVVAALYASGVTPQKMEWLFYKFFNESKKNKIYSIKWFKKLDEIILKEIKVTSIEKLKIAMYLPGLTKKGVFGLYGSGNIKSVLISNIKAFSKYGHSQHQYNFFGDRFFNRIGVDILIGIDVLGENILFERGDDYLAGIFGKVVGKIQKEKNNPKKKIYSLYLEEYPLDSYDDPSPYLKKPEKQSKEMVEDIFKMIKKWENGQTNILLRNYEKFNS